MKRVAALALVALAVLASPPPPAVATGGTPASDGRMRPQIVNGEPAEDGWWNVVLVANESGRCTGTLVAPRWVLTAAHCVGPDTLIGGGSNRISQFTWVDEPVAAYVHPGYDEETARWDFALYQLSAPHPNAGYEVRLAEPAADDQPLWQPGAPVLVLGWGVTEDGETPDELRQVELVVQDDQDCYDVSGIWYDPNVSVCAWAQDRSACQGDSGGPVFGMAEDELVHVGVTSWGTSGCQLLSVSAWVPGALAWIESVIGGGDRTTYRLFGTDRFATAAVIASLWDEADTVYVATGSNFPDSLAAGPAAAAAGAPILLVERDQVPEATRRELDRLDPRTIVVLGGTAAVSDAVVQELRQWGDAVRRAGRTRFETAVAVSQAAFPEGSESVVVAPARDFTDGLIGGAAGANGFGPLLLVEGGAGLEDMVRDEIVRLGADFILLVGDSAAVSASTRQALSELGDVVALDHPDPHVRSTQAWAGLEETAAVVLATSAKYPDGLAGAGLAGNLAAPLLLVPGDCVPDAVAEEIERWEPDHLVVLGGRSAINADVEDLRRC